ncbi:MAG: SET domain-containing protein [Actinobacteria bacterium]|nr:SET domain-containing protein [Actinomycetota bacterium]
MDRGVFANKIFQPGELIETTPVIVISMAEWRIMKKTVLNNYAFSFEEDSQEMAIALGFGSLYNHSYNPNASYFKRIKEKVIDFYAIRLIKGGEEITINYNGDPNSTDLLWFNRD